MRAMRQGWGALSLGVLLGLSMLLGPARLWAAGISVPKEIQILTAVAPGGGPDIMARAVAEFLQQEHGIRASVVNLPAVNGELALAQLKESPPDGARWLLAQDSVIVVNPSIYPRASADPLQGVLPVAQTGSNVFFLMVRAEDPARTFEQWLAEARADGRPMNFASGGVGSMHHLILADLAHRLELNLHHVPYAGGGAAAMGLARGEVRVTLGGSSSMPLVKANKLRILAVGSERALPDFPGVPAMHEVLPGFEATAWFAWYAPEGTPAEMVAEMAEALEQAMSSPVVTKALAERSAGLQPEYLGTEALAAKVRREHERFSAVIERLPGLKP